MSLTSGQHQGAFAHAVVVVHVFGAKVCSVDHQTALSARRPTVALQGQSESRRGENRLVEMMITE